MNKEQIDRKLSQIKRGYQNKTGFMTEQRQKQEYAFDHYHELVSLVEDALSLI